MNDSLRIFYNKYSKILHPIDINKILEEQAKEIPKIHSNKFPIKYYSLNSKFDNIIKFSFYYDKLKYCNNDELIKYCKHKYPKNKLYELITDNYFVSEQIVHYVETTNFVKNKYILENIKIIIYQNINNKLTINLSKLF